MADNQKDILAMLGDRNIDDPLAKYIAVRAQIARILEDITKPPKR